MQEPQHNHAGIPSQLAMELWRAGQIDSFAQLESWLREMGSRVFLIAVPTQYFGDQFDAMYPVPRDDTPDYVLWTEVNGSEVAQKRLATHELTPQENMKRLERTGLLKLRSE